MHGPVINLRVEEVFARLRWIKPIKDDLFCPEVTPSCLDEAKNLVDNQKPLEFDHEIVQTIAKKKKKGCKSSFRRFRGTSIPTLLTVQ